MISLMSYLFFLKTLKVILDMRPTTHLQSGKLHTLGKATGSAGDSLRRHHKMNFSSQDQDNDKHDSNCAKMYTGGWWYNDCHDRYIQTFLFGWKTFANFSFCFSNLMGKYKDNTDGKGVNWRAWHGHEYSLKRAVMMIRPTK